MRRQVLKLRGFYYDSGKIKTSNGTVLDWKELSEEEAPSIPYGTILDISIQYEQRDFLHGTENIVWATYDKRQAEIICNALLPQKIACEILTENLGTRTLHLIHIPYDGDISFAIDFIWRENSGLRLKPDWNYPNGAANESFKKWIEGI
ncbi:MAG: hypothetical protein Kow0042_25850 [Calditrichia bacterium]